MQYHSYMEPKKDTNELIPKTEKTHRHRRQNYGYQKGQGFGGGVN